MIEISVKFSGGGTRSLAGKAPFPLTFSQDQMRRGAEFALATVKARTRQGIGSDDAPMLPLGVARHVKGRRLFKVAGYAAWKASKGLQPIRDMWGIGKGGHMLENATVRSVSATSAKMAFTARLARSKALTNENRTPFFSFSEKDQRDIVAWFSKEMQSVVENVSQSLQSRWRKTA